MGKPEKISVLTQPLTRGAWAVFRTNSDTASEHKILDYLSALCYPRNNVARKFKGHEIGRLPTAGSARKTVRLAPQCGAFVAIVFVFGVLPTNL